jgi:hypothetical protein
MMSDQIMVNLSLNVQSSGLTDNKNYNFTDMLATQALASGVQVATTNFAALTIGDMASTDIGVIVLHNLDTNNYLTYGSTLGEFKLDPLEFAFNRVNPGVTLQIRANTANVKVEKYILGK